ncbi:helix-turn-helix domain-containing protein [Kribbella sp. NBC_00889]|uniref:helix-turn-helix domain-containing protein n=1 Tax=Kribbella sp. NBC_00889 TaxID=2975974 RepID=UPI00386E90DE
MRPDEPAFPDTRGGYRDPTNVRRSLRSTLSPVGSTARRDLGLTIRAIRRVTGLTRQQTAATLNWPQTRLELIETGRIKVDHHLATELLSAYGRTLDDFPPLRAEIDQAAQPSEADKLTWIRSHALRKPQPPPSIWPLTCGFVLINSQR